jgi:hypothetical protein
MKVDLGPLMWRNLKLFYRGLSSLSTQWYAAAALFFLITRPKLILNAENNGG